MANIIVKNEERRREAEKILKQYGADRSDPGIREAADTVAARQNEMIDKAQKRRRYY